VPLCSIIIPVYNLAAVTCRCLDQLLAYPPEGCDREVIVVDDGSRDSTAEALARYGDRVRVVTHARNLGFATACNDGAAAAGGDSLVFLNNDTVPTAGWLDALVRYAGDRPRVGVVGSKLLYPDGSVQHAGMVFDADRHPRHIYVGFPDDHPAVNKSRRFQSVTGGCFLATREAFDGAGGFDASFTNGFEDVDFCLRLGTLGFEVHYCHESVLFHLESISDGRGSHSIRNLQPYRERWADRVESDDVRYYVEDGLLRVDYSPMCPLRIRIDPLLGVLDEEGRRGEADRLLALRSEQVRDLLRENISLMVQGLADPIRA
jgi:GT2 family glycosyltransferase